MTPPATMIGAMRAFLCLLLIPLSAVAQTHRSEEHAFRVTTVVDRLDHPWCVAFLPDGGMLITERDGRLNRIAKGGQRTNVEGVPPVFAQGQGGLFDIALHPEFAKNGVVYLSYAGPGSGGASTELMRARLDGNRLAEAKVIFRQEPKTSGGL